MHTTRALLVACSLAFAGSGTAFAQDATGALKAQVEALQRQLDEVKSQLQKVQGDVQAQKQDQQKLEQERAKEHFLELKDGPGTTFLVRGGGEVTLYGNLDVSFDYTTKGLNGSYDPGGTPIGNLGWQGAVSTNLSYLGARGKHPLQQNLAFDWQLEAGIDISATPGTKDSNSANDNSVNGALFSRNSFLGFSGDEWGLVRIGKNETPYKTATDRLNPFSGMLGDYRVVMGNTGGDNRTEFAYRAAHAIWYESSNWRGASFKAMVSPGQNRADDSSILATGEPGCAGGNAPGSGALPPACNDGAFSSLYSLSAAYAVKPLYLTAAYEMHKKVNRTSDTIGFPTTSAGDLQGDPNDVGDEYALKIGGQYTLPTKTTVNVLWERTHRKVPGYLEYQNERTRPNAWWTALTQEITSKDNVSFGWAHAGKTPGDTGQHNTTGGSGPDNSANMYAAAWRHIIDRNLSVYADWAMTVNHRDSHYDLGAGGHTNTTDCHDASQLAAFDPTTGGVTGDGPHCFAGGRIQGVSAGVDYRF